MERACPGDFSTSQASSSSDGDPLSRYRYSSPQLDARSDQAEDLQEEGEVEDAGLEAKIEVGGCTEYRHYLINVQFGTDSNGIKSR